MIDWMIQGIIDWIIPWMTDWIIYWMTQSMTEGMIQGMTEGIIEGIIPWVIQGVTEGVVPGMLRPIGQALCLLVSYGFSNWLDGTDLVPCCFTSGCYFSSNVVPSAALFSGRGLQSMNSRDWMEIRVACVRVASLPSCAGLRAIRRKEPPTRC